METFDVIDEKDNIIGQASRKECHSNPNLIHRVVHFTLIDYKKDKVLLTLRSPNVETDPNKYTFQGEHVISGETFGKALVRGIDEELGFKSNEFLEAGKRLFHEHGQTELARFFIVKWKGQNLKFSSKEIVDHVWYSVNEMKECTSFFPKMTKHWIHNINWEEAFQRK